MDLALLVLRVVVGLFFAGHGAQKLFGKFGGHGLDGTAGFFESLGMRPGRVHAAAAGAAELTAGVLLVLGLATPLAAALIIAVMTVAIVTAHASKGPWVTDGGYEYNVVLIAAAFALAGAGPGELSLDGAIGWMADVSGTGWALGALGAGLLGAVGALASARLAAPAPEPEPEPAAAERTGRFTREPQPAEEERVPR
jgi:putative oxidoreductase